MSIRRCIRFFRDERGGTLVLLGATMPLLIAAAAIGVDTIQLTLSKRALQRMADSAALAGAQSLIRNNPAAAAVDRDLVHNNRVTLSTPRVIENAPTSGPNAGNNRAVRVILTATRPTPFMSFFTGTASTVRVEATGAAVLTGRYCLVALESQNYTGVTFTGSGNAALGCGVASNSPAGIAIEKSGSGVVTASPIAAVGGVPPASSFSGTTVVISGNPPVADPYATLANPTVPTPCAAEVNVGPQETRDITPGCYNGWSIRGTLNLAPGTYYINAANVDINSQATVTGTGVTIVMTSSTASTYPETVGTININGGATINLTAPTTGEYAGLLLYVDRRAPMRNNSLSGNSSSSYDGAFYLPSQETTFIGNAGMDTICFKLVSRRATITGNADIVNDCPANRNDRDFLVGYTARLVG